MKIALKFLLLATLLTGFVLPTAAQEPSQPYKASGVYNIKFVVSELENGKTTNQRVYTAVVREERKGSLKTGNRVPVATGSKSSEVPMQWQYLDVGFNADFLVSEREGHIDLDFSGDLSAMVPPDPSSPTPGGNPVLRQVRQAINTSIADGKPTVIASLDDVSSKKTVQLEVTVTKVRKS